MYFRIMAVKIPEKKEDSVQADSLSSQVSLHTGEQQLLNDQMELDSNPLHWTQEDVYQYLIKTDDCADIAQKCKDEVCCVFGESLSCIKIQLSDFQHKYLYCVSRAIDHYFTKHYTLVLNQ
jgi:hypothetical protein